MFSFNDLVEKKGRALVMGILNVTPDSFSDGGEAFTQTGVLEKLNRLCNDGADIIDIGACSTAPDNTIVSEEEEIRRLKLFLPEVVKNSTVPVSIDTFRPGVAAYALSQGVSIINDESGIFNTDMAELVKRYKCGWIFMHTGEKSSKETAVYEKGVLNDVISFFSDMKRKAIIYSIDENQLCFDCGIGFGKTRDDDIALLSNCDILSEDYLLLVGASRKRVIGEITGEEEPKKRVQGSVAVATIVCADGASVVRVHDVKETVDAINVIKTLRRGVYNGKDNY